MGKDPAVSARKTYRNRWNTLVPKDKVKAYRAYLQRYHKDDREAETYDIKGAFLAGEKPDEYGHMTDRYKKPNHPTFSTDSQYHGRDGEEGGTWDDKSRTFMPGKSNTKYRKPEDLKKFFAWAEHPTGWKLSDKWKGLKNAP